MEPTTAGGGGGSAPKQSNLKTAGVKPEETPTVASGRGIENPLKRKADSANTATAEKQKPVPPRHGKRLFIEAILYQHDQYGREKKGRARLLDCDCTRPILNGDFEKRDRIP